MLERTDQPALDCAGTERIECGYRNTSDRMVIVRCCGPHAFYLERVVFPFELLSFHCPPQSELEIWTHGLGGPELIEVLRAEEVKIEAAPAPVGSLASDGGDSPWWLQAS